MGITERREREKEQRKNDIVDAAERVFFKRGHEYATMDDVAIEAELSKGGNDVVRVGPRTRGMS